MFTNEIEALNKQEETDSEKPQCNKRKSLFEAYCEKEAAAKSAATAANTASNDETADAANTDEKTQNKKMKLNE